MATTNKAYELPQSPIIFKARGIVSDVRFNVFGTWFHVHSSILKLYSHYFFSYLDALGSPTAVAGTAFKYDWTTKVVDAGGDWQLVSNNEKAGDLNVKDFKGDPKIQALAFYKLVCAMYSLPFVLRDPGELILLTAMARFYAALPVLSRSLLNTIPRSPGFLTCMQGKAVELLVAAKELRHPELFKDCLLLCLGPWGFPQFNQLEDQQLKSVAIHARKELCFGVYEAQARIVHAMGDSNYADSIKTALGTVEFNAARSLSYGGDYIHQWGDQVCMPCYYSKLLNANLSYFQSEIRKSFEPLMEDRLSLINANNLRRRSCYFLGLEIRDEDLPWNQTQTDW